MGQQGYPSKGLQTPSKGLQTNPVKGIFRHFTRGILRMSFTRGILRMSFTRGILRMSEDLLKPEVPAVNIPDAIQRRQQQAKRFFQPQYSRVTIVEAR